ncbi:hypothetical protein DXG01_016153 [Tephrocybe rancida]|nr:hypothetical protein DXG01_016153 [Tephrocybe rancida]
MSSAAVTTAANYLKIAGASIYAFDYLQTIPAEIRLYRKQKGLLKLSVACWLLIAVRVLAAVASHAVFIFRTYAICGRSRVVLYCLLVVGGLLSVAEIVSPVVVPRNSKLGATGNCISDLSKVRAFSLTTLDKLKIVNFSGFDELDSVPVVFDLIILGLTIDRLFRGTHMKLVSRSEFTKIFWESQIMYFVAVTAVNIVNLIFFIKYNKSSESTMFATLGMAITAIFSAHVILDLHEITHNRSYSTSGPIPNYANGIHTTTYRNGEIVERQFRVATADESKSNTFRMDNLEAGGIHIQREVVATSDDRASLHSWDRRKANGKVESEDCAEDLLQVITFRATKPTSLSKQQIRADSRKAEQQYTRLIDTLTLGGLRAVGRRGESLGHLLVLISCPDSHVESLTKRERQSDFLSGLPIKSLGSEAEHIALSPADRIRLVHGYVTSMPTDGGLGIVPKSSDWDLVESVMALHNREFNETWVRSWTPRQIASVQLEKIRGQALVFPAALGFIYYFFGTPYSPVYSSLVFVWSVVFVEWWRVRERILSLRFGTRGSFRVEKRRADYKPGFSWWQRELRILASLPVLLIFAGTLVSLLTGIFFFEAFVTQLYAGPGKQFIFLKLYQILAVRLTTWENHAHYSSYSASLTLKTFALSALVAYLGLGLSAFVYVPFGEGVMQFMQTWLFYGVTEGSLMASASNTTNTTVADGVSEKSAPGRTGGLWDVNKSNAKHKLNPGRLRDQMFAYTVTNQAVNTFVEVGLPFVLRALASFRNGRKGVSTPGSPGEKNGVKKRVVFEDEKEKGGMVEREFLDNVRAEVALPEYEIFQDYSEIVTQFGYVAVWSSIWPLASVMALLNNFLELRSDAFKMTVHNRRPIPVRTDTIGPWLEALTFLSWLSALTNSALVYLFCPRSVNSCSATPDAHTSQLDRVHQHLIIGADSEGSAATKELLLTALLIAFAASHGYFFLRVIVRHVIERVFWKGSEEVKEREKDDREIKGKFLQGYLVEDARKSEAAAQPDDAADATTVEARQGISTDADAVFGFWDNDEGLEEISRVSKEV